MFFKESGEKEAKISEADQAVACFKQGINCSQALLSTYGKHYGLDPELALRVSGAFGSGMGMGETCGAVTGALMVIGLKHSKAAGSRLFSKDKTGDVAYEFMERFKARHGTMVCKELLGCDVSTPEGLKTAKQKKHFKKRCPEYVQDAALILEELLKD